MGVMSVIHILLSKTHNIAMTSPIADFVVSLGSDGRVVSQGTISTALKLNKDLSAEVEADKQDEQLVEEVMDAETPNAPAKPGSGKLIVAEEIAEGHVSFDASEIAFLF
jgi:hypothetical protein